MPTEFIIMIVLISCMGMVTGLVSDWLKTKRKIALAQASASVNEDTLRQLESITKRLAALEAIVTDDDKILHRQIEQLKDEAQRSLA